MSRRRVSPLLQHLNADVLSVIMDFDPSIVPSLMMICKALSKLVSSRYSKSHCALGSTGITLRFTQCILRDTFRDMTTGTILFQARKSFGKTIAGYACAGNYGMVLITSNLMKVWLSEAKMLGWYNPNPAKSRVICFAGVKNHETYIKRVLASGDKIILPLGAILLVPDHKLNMGMQFLQTIDTEEPRTLIIDEAHLNRPAIREAQSYGLHTYKPVFHKQLLLSADVMSPVSCGISEPYRMVSVKQLDEVPDIVWNIIPLWERRDAWLDVLNSALKQHTKVALVATKEQLDSIELSDKPLTKGPQGRRAKNKEYRGAKIFYQKTGIDTIPKFNSCKERSILLINTAQNTGINVLAHALVMPEAGITNSIRITQTVGRVVRTTNDTSEVQIYLCAKDEQAFIRCHYARCYYNEDWKYPFDTLPSLSYLKKCVSLLHLLGTTVTDVNSVDGCVIFCDIILIENRQAIVDWWKLYHTKDSVLTETMVTNLMCIEK